MYSFSMFPRTALVAVLLSMAACFPAQSSNPGTFDFARDLGLDRSAAIAALDARPLAAEPTPQTIVFGQSVVQLTGPWMFSPGDSPWITGASGGHFLWAEPGFDDSRWASMDLTPPSGSNDVQFSGAGFIPGWTARGYPNLRGYAWYRLRIRVQDPGQRLWIEMPIDVDDAYQVFANGSYIGQFGEFEPKSVRLHYGQSRLLQLPPPGPDGVFSIALRFYMSDVSHLRWPEVGGLHLPPLLGLVSTLTLRHDADETILREAVTGHELGILFCLLALPAALWAAIANRRDRAWLWLVLALAATLLGEAAQTAGHLSTQVSMWAGEFWGLTVAVPLMELFWVQFWYSWFGLNRRLWVLRAAAILTFIWMVAGFCYESPLLGFHFASQSLLLACSRAVTICFLMPGLLLFIVLIEGYRRDRTAALLATLPILLSEFADLYIPMLVIFRFAPYIYIDGLSFQYNDLAPIAMLLMVGALSMRRFLANRDRDLIERESAARDLEQARQLQQSVLIPESIASPCYSVAVEYRPAQTVGGDFFQTIAQPDGTLLVLIGDVSGKGVSAAMLVAVLVGAARAIARRTSDPAALLAELNTQLRGRSGGHFATCIAASLDPNGTLQFANAGHLPPYLNGSEIAVEGSLPLGIAEHLDSATQRLQLSPGDTLTFITDGVVEAANSAGELFGFERTCEISTHSAAQIAAAAQAFGQEDDITVLTLTFAHAEVLYA